LVHGEQLPSSQGEKTGLQEEASPQQVQESKKQAASNKPSMY